MQRKANKRSGGVGYESEMILSEIRNKPLQRKYIPVVIEHDENGELPLPNFLKSRYCIDLSKDTGYGDLLSAIRNLKENNPISESNRLDSEFSNILKPNKPFITNLIV